MDIRVTRDGWFFVSQNIGDLLEIIKGSGLMMNIDSVEDLLFGEEQFILLKAIVCPEKEEIEDFYLTRAGTIANIHTDRSIDMDVKKTEVHIGAGLYKDGERWNLFVPLEV